MSKQFYFEQFNFEKVRSLNVKKVLFQAIQFSLSTQFSSIWRIDGNEKVLRIPQIVLDMTLNNLMVGSQWYWSFVECGAPLYCHCSQFHSGP